MRFSTRLVGGIACLLVAACAHQPVAPVPQDKIVVSTGTATAPAAGDSTGSTPSLSMPAEWQHHNGEDYDDLFDRPMRGAAGQEPGLGPPTISASRRATCSTLLESGDDQRGRSGRAS